MNRNRAESNRITDTNGFAIYMQFQNTPANCRNNSTANNILKDVCPSGIQHTSLAFAGIGWGPAMTAYPQAIRSIGPGAAASRRLVSASKTSHRAASSAWLLRRRDKYRVCQLDD